jgi:hypothetical protein
MAMSYTQLRHEAVERYYDSIRQAKIQEQWARITGKKCALLKYEDVANRLHIRQQIPLGLHMVRLDQIVGSVGRYREFTSTFLPRTTVLLDRWVAVDIMMNSLKGPPPIELYKVGEGHFVIDGNHRISVARANGNKDVEAFVIECQTTLDLTVDDFIDERWLIKVARSEFFAQTHLDQLYPEQRLDVTTPEAYQTLLQHIAVHRYLSNQPARRPDGLGEGRELSWVDAVVSWYDKVYIPVIEAIRTHKVQAHFPKRTEAELYIRVAQYREIVAEQYGLAPLDPETAVTAFAAGHSERLLHAFLLTLQQTIRNTMRHRLPHKLHQRQEQVKIPPGISKDIFCALRLRHDAGELSLTEAGQQQTQEAFFVRNLYESHHGIQYSA